MDFDRLDAILKERRISRRKLAIAVGIPESTMSTAFMRRSGLSSDDVLKIAQFLGVSPYYLEGWTVKLSDEESVYHDDAADYINVRNARFYKDGKYMGATVVDPSVSKGEALEEFLMLEAEQEQRDPNFTKIENDYHKLNKLGQIEAAKRVGELTEIPRYTKTDIGEQKSD